MAVILPAIVILISALFRSIHLAQPLLGNFAIYQTAQAMMARFFIQDNFTSLLYPKVNILVNGKPSLLLLYYPVSSFVSAFATHSFGGNLEMWGRLQAVIFFALAALYLYFLVLELADQRIALASLIIFCLFPLTIIYGRSFQNEMATVFFTIFSVFYTVRFLKQASFFSLLWAVLGMSLVLLTRPNNLYLFGVVLYLGLPLHNYFKTGGRGLLKVVLILSLSLILPFAWFYHVWLVSNQYDNIYSTVFAQLMVRSSFASPLIFNFDFYPHFFDVLSGIVLTPFGFSFFILGFLLAFKDWKKYGIFILWCLGFLASSLLIPRKLIDHNFYWLHFILPAAPVIALGISTLFEVLKRNRLVLVMLFLFAFASSMRYTVHPAFKIPDVDRGKLELAQRVKDITQKETDRIVVQGIHDLLYYADRYGKPFSVKRGTELSDYYTKMNWEKWPQDKWERRNQAYLNSVTALEFLREEEGYAYFVVTNPAEFFEEPAFSTHVLARYKAIFRDDKVGLIFDLRHPNS